MLADGHVWSGIVWMAEFMQVWLGGLDVWLGLSVKKSQHVISLNPIPTSVNNDDSLSWPYIEQYRQGD